jgi:hypothetical protein
MFSFRYLWLKLKHVGEVAAACQDVAFSKNALARSPAKPALGSESEANSEVIVRLVRAALFGPITRLIKFTGPAMAPTLNRNCSAANPSSEWVLVRQLPYPGTECVSKGDVICFQHPIGISASSLLIRRVTAIGGEQLVGDEEEMTLDHDTVWVEADNAKLEPPNVEDSRTFGPLPMAMILGRCIYAATSLTDHALIQNAATWKDDDKEIVEFEFDPETVFGAEKSDKDDIRGEAKKQGGGD